MKAERKPATPPPPPDEIVITLTLREAQSLKRGVSRSLDTAMYPLHLVLLSVDLD